MTATARIHDALRAQLERRRALLDAGAEHVGWKIGAGIPEIDALTAGAPVFGYLTSRSVLAPGATHDAAGARALRAETELLIEVGGGVGVALELVDVGRPPDDMEGIVAANVFHRAAVLGRERVPALPDGAEARLWIDGELRGAVPVAVDAAASLERLAALLEPFGETLRDGDLVLAGSVIHVPATPGSHVVAEIEGVGRVPATIGLDAPARERGGSSP